VADGFDLSSKGHKFFPRHSASLKRFSHRIIKQKVCQSNKLGKKEGHRLPLCDFQAGRAILGREAPFPYGFFISQLSIILNTFHFFEFLSDRRKVSGLLSHMRFLAFLTRFAIGLSWLAATARQRRVLERRC
jgi:hypothetical protein